MGLSRCDEESRAVDLRNARTLLEEIPYEPGVYRCPKDMAPQQFGYVTCPLQPNGSTVTVDLGGYIDPERGSEWRAGLVAVNSKNEARYGEIFAKGKNSMTLNPDEKELYLVVAATPKTMMIDMAGEGPSADYRSFEQSQFPFTVKLTGCSPKTSSFPPSPRSPARRIRTAADSLPRRQKSIRLPTSAPTLRCSTSPGSRLRPHRGLCRRERRRAVRDHAVVSGHGLVSGSGVVKDYGKVRDFGNNTSVVADFAKLAEHGANGGKMTEYATAKGCSATFGNNYGTSIVDGMYAKSNEVSKGIWLTWSWGQGKNAGELDEDLGGVYAQYLFDKKHPYLAWDTKGVTHGYLVGNPTVENGILTLNGKDQFVEMPKDVADHARHDVGHQGQLDRRQGPDALWAPVSDAKNYFSGSLQTSRVSSSSHLQARK